MSQSPDRENAPEGDTLRILVVDDEPTLRLGFSYALSSRTNRVETAATGRLALDRMAESHFDIILLDLRMPDLDGMGVIQALRDAGNEIPIILCSAALNPDAALRAIRHGVVDFLLKPVRPGDLRQAVERVIHPDPSPLPQALRAARFREMGTAIEILANETLPGVQSGCWLNLLRSIQNASQDGDDSKSLEMIRSHISLLAFNAPTS